MPHARTHKNAPGKAGGFAAHAVLWSMMSSGSTKGKSTRLAIVEQSLTDTVERLRELPAGAQAREFRAKAESYDRALKAWMTRAPTEEQRSALLRLVLELNVEVMEVGRGVGSAAGNGAGKKA